MSDMQPVRLWEETVDAAWVDYNAHMNVAFYVLIFDHATNAFLEHIGMDEKHRLETGSSVFVTEAPVTYDQEVMEGERVFITTQVLGHDTKRLHLFHRMYNSRDDRLCATNELMILHVNLNDRKVGPFPGAVLDRITRVGSAHAGLDKPAASGRAIAMRR